MRSEEPGTAELARAAAGWPVIRVRWVADGRPCEVALTARQANTLGEALIMLAGEAWALEYDDFATRGG